MGKIDVLKETPTEFQFGDTADATQKRREEREQKKRGGGGIETEGGETEGGSHEVENYTLSRSGSGQKVCTHKQE